MEGFPIDQAAVRLDVPPAGLGTLPSSRADQTTEHLVL